MGRVQTQFFSANKALLFVSAITTGGKTITRVQMQTRHYRSKSPRNVICVTFLHMREQFVVSGGEKGGFDCRPITDSGQMATGKRTRQEGGKEKPHRLATAGFL
jgi:hypothetical protein